LSATDIELGESKKVCACGCGKIINTEKRYVSRFIIGHNLRLFDHHGSKHPMWKGGITRNSGGYVERYKPDHHFATRRGYVREHRLVWEQFHKASLLSWAVVHHKNKKKLDNRIENLEAVISNSKHHKIFHRSGFSDRRCNICGRKFTLVKLIRGDYYHHYWYRDLNDKSKWVCSWCNSKQTWPIRKKRLSLKGVEVD
jgi:hypothetical protein